jgi:demethylmenaquinone methyltransferase/2-methoxy-6-polyprenyl-1,4-benzoquinol methylase
MDSRFRTPSDLAAAMDDADLDPRVVDRGFGYTVVGVRR